MKDASTWENRGAHLTLSVGERGWSEFVRASRHQKMALQRSSERQHSNHLLGLPWRLLKKTQKSKLMQEQCHLKLKND